MPISPSAGQTVNIYAGLTGVLPVSVSGVLSATISGTVTVSQTNVQGTTSGAPVWVTGAVTQAGGGNSNITASIPLNVTSTQANPVWVTGNIGGGGGSGGNVAITASIPLTVTSTFGAPVWVTGTVNATVVAQATQSVTFLTSSVLSASILNLPATQSVSFTTSSVLSATITNWPTTFPGNVNITQSITLPVSATNPVTASVSNFPVGFNANITASIPLSVTSTVAAPVWVTGVLTVNTGSSVSGYGTGSAVLSNNTGTLVLGSDGTNLRPIKTDNVGVVAVSASNLPTSITASFSGVMPVSATNPITASISNFPAVQQVTSTFGAPVWVTGILTVNTGSAIAGYGTGSLVSANNTGTLFLGSDGTNLRAVKTDAAGVVAVSSTNSPVFPVGFNSNITASIPLTVTSTQASPVWVTGNLGGGGSGGNVSVYVDAGAHAATGTLANVAYSTVVGKLLNANSNRAGLAIYNSSSAELFIATTSSLSITNFSYRVASRAEFELPPPLYTGDVWGVWAAGGAGAALVTEYIATSQSNNPLYVTSTQANPIYVTGTLAATFTPPTYTQISGVVNITQSIPLNVTSTQGAPIWVTGSTGGSPNVNITQSITLAVSATNPVTASIANFPVGFNANITASIPLQVTSTAGSPVWVTGTLTVNTGTGGGVTGYGTGSAILNANTGSLVLGSDGTNLRPFKLDAVGVLAVSSTNSPVFPVGFNSNITASITLPVSATNPVTASISNFPTGFNVNVTATVGHDIRITGSNVWLSSSIVGTVPVTSTAGAPVWVTGAISVSDAGTSLTVDFLPASILTASVSNFPTTFPGNVNITGSNVWLSSSIVGTVPVTSTALAPLWVTGILTVNTGTSSGGAGVQYGTGSTTPYTGTLFLGSDGTSNIAVKTDAAGQIYVANPGSPVGPTTGTVTSVAAVSTAGGILLLASNASRKGSTFFNNASTNLYISLGTTATVTSFQVLLIPNSYYEAPYAFTGHVSGAWSGTPTGNVLVGENT